MPTTLIVPNANVDISPEDLPVLMPTSQRTVGCAKYEEAPLKFPYVALVINGGNGMVEAEDGTLWEGPINADGTAALEEFAPIDPETWSDWPKRVRYAFRDGAARGA